MAEQVERHWRNIQMHYICMCIYNRNNKTKWTSIPRPRCDKGDVTERSPDSLECDDVATRTPESRTRAWRVRVSVCADIIITKMAFCNCFIIYKKYLFAWLMVNKINRKIWVQIKSVTTLSPWTMSLYIYIYILYINRNNTNIYLYIYIYIYTQPKHCLRIVDTEANPRGNTTTLIRL